MASEKSPIILDQKHLELNMEVTHSKVLLRYRDVQALIQENPNKVLLKYQAETGEDKELSLPLHLVKKPEHPLLLDELSQNIKH